jgi:hypothetical protein
MTVSQLCQGKEECQKCATENTGGEAGPSDWVSGKLVGSSRLWSRKARSTSRQDPDATTPWVSCGASWSLHFFLRKAGVTFVPSLCQPVQEWTGCNSLCLHPIQWAPIMTSRRRGKLRRGGQTIHPWSHSCYTVLYQLVAAELIELPAKGPAQPGRAGGASPRVQSGPQEGGRWTHCHRRASSSLQRLFSALKAPS